MVKCAHQNVFSAETSSHQIMHHLTLNGHVCETRLRCRILSKRDDTLSGLRLIIMAATGWSHTFGFILQFCQMFFVASSDDN